MTTMGGKVTDFSDGSGAEARRNCRALPIERELALDTFFDLPNFQRHGWTCGASFRSCLKTSSDRSPLQKS
jgi:hypothetical protein